MTTMARRYRKRPVEIDAVRCDEVLHAAANDWYALPKWLRDAYDTGVVLFLADSVVIKTLEGPMTANHDDMIICGVEGELYPCKPTIFAASYDKIEETA